MNALKALCDKCLQPPRDQYPQTPYDDYECQYKWITHSVFDVEIVRDLQDEGWQVAGPFVSGSPMHWMRLFVENPQK